VIQKTTGVYRNQNKWYSSIHLVFCFACFMQQYVKRVAGPPYLNMKPLLSKTSSGVQWQLSPKLHFYSWALHIFEQDYSCKLVFKNCSVQFTVEEDRILWRTVTPHAVRAQSCVCYAIKCHASLWFSACMPLCGYLLPCFANVASDVIFTHVSHDLFHHLNSSFHPSGLCQMYDRCRNECII